ncbi:MAG: S8 family serine peptidase, partial [Betaproteobacteria bacterium]|nr:S8 family serine peptidase [Betaproteobacteria bacterium]
FVFALGNDGLHDGDNASYYHRTVIERPYATLTLRIVDVQAGVTTTSTVEVMGYASDYLGTLAMTASFTIANNLSVPLGNNVDIRQYGLDATLNIEGREHVTRAATGYFAGMYLLPGQQALKPYWLAVAASQNITVNGVATVTIGTDSQGCGVLWDRCLTAPGAALALFNDLADATKTKHIYGEGTSFAAPYVTGALALLKSQSPSLRADAASEILLRTADDLGPEGPDPIYGMGHLNIAKALSPVGPITSRAQGGGVNLAGSYLRLAGPLVALAQASSNLAVTGYDSYSRAFYLPVAGMITSASPADNTPAAQRELNQRQRYIQRGGRFAAGYRSGQLNWLSFAAADGLLIRHELCAPECLASDTGWGLMPQHLELESVTRLQQEILPGNLLALEASAASSSGSAAQWRQLALRSAGSPFAGLWLAAEGGLLAESETLLGSEFGGGFALNDGASSRFVHLTGKLQLGAGMHGYGSYALIGSQAQVPGNGVLVGLSALRADALAVGVRKSRLWRADDSLRFEFSQPLAVRQGDLLLFAGADGADAAPSQIALNLGQQPRPTVWTLSYSAPMSVLGMSGFFGAALEKRSNAGVFGQDALSYSLAINLSM